MKKLLPIITVILSCACLVTAEDAERKRPEGQGGKGCPDIREARTEAHKLMRKHHEEQRKDIQAFRKSLQDLEPDQRLEKIVAFRTKHHAENVAFHKERHAAMLATIKACEHMPKEKKQEMVNRLSEQHKQAVAFHSMMHKKLVTFLRELKKSDKTPEEKMAAWKQFQEDMKEEMKDWREEHRRGRPNQPERPEGKEGRKKQKGQKGERKPKAE